MSQYRNKTIFWFMKDFSEKYFVTFKWIYLESGHGKGVPNGIGATVKKVIHNLVACNPKVQIYNVDDLLDLKLSDIILSIIVMKHTTDQIDKVKEDILQDLISAPNTMKMHQVYSTPSGEFFLKNLSKENNAQ